MKKRVMIEIEICELCPYSDQVFVLGKGPRIKCYKDSEEGRISDQWPSMSIPDWCTLEDVERR